MIYTFEHEGTFDIRGRGTVYYGPSPFGPEIKTPSDILGSSVMIDGKKMRVLGVERHPTPCMKTGEKIGLLAKEEQE